MTIEQWPIDKPQPYPKNARKISDAAIAKVALSLREYGWQQPLVVDKDGVLIVGHARLLAAKSLGMATVPVLVAANLTPEQVRAYRLMDNRSHQETAWDDVLLVAELADLQALTVDLSLTGFDEDELARLLIKGSAGLTDEDATPALPEFATTQPGDVWLCGKHRVRCGDSTVATDVFALLAGVKPRLMVTDPPYGVEYDAGWRGKARNADGSLLSTGEHRAVGKVSNDGNADWREAWALFPGDVAYVWHAGNKAHIVAESLLASGFDLRSQIIWAKSQFVIGRGHYHPHHEPCWYAVRQSGTGHWNGDRTQSTLWQIPKPQKSETGHSTQKPVECMKRPIENNSNPGQAVYDPFLGSGTTLIAAEQTGRICYGMELDPKYCDVIVKRWQDFTGLKAVLEVNGQEFKAA